MAMERIQFCCMFLLSISGVLHCMLNFNSLQIKNLTIVKCDSKNYPVIVNNVSIQFGTKPKIKVSGSLFSQVDLVSPVKASVSIKRLILGIWIPMPCKNKLGSCTYNNLCDYGYPTNVTCPEVFLKNNVPCRCPIPMGNYTITPTVAFQLPKNTSILAGTYKGTITITDNKLLLSCYNVYFVLYDADYNSVYSVIQV